MLVKFEQTRTVKTTQNIELFDKKMVIHFRQNDDVILEEVSVTETIV